MLTDFVFDFELENEKVLVGRHRLVKPIFGAKYVQLVESSPSIASFVITCDLIDDFLSNNEHNKGEPVLGMSLSGIGAHPLTPIRILHYGGRNLSGIRIQYIRLLLRIFSQAVPTSLLEMKQTVFFLRLERSSNSMNVNYRFPKPLHGVKWIRVLSWVTERGYDYLMCPILAGPSWGKEVDMPLLAFGESGKPRMWEAMRVAEQHSTMNSLIIKMVRPNNVRYGLDYALLHLVIFHE